MWRQPTLLYNVDVLDEETWAQLELWRPWLPAQFDLDDLGSEHRSSIDEEIMTTLEVGIDDLGNDSNWRPWWRAALTTLFISKEIDCLVLEGILLVDFILVKLYAFGPFGAYCKIFFRVFWEKKMKKNQKKKCLGVRRQRMSRFPCLQDCLLTLTCHLAQLYYLPLRYLPAFLCPPSLSHLVHFRPRRRVFIFACASIS